MKRVDRHDAGRFAIVAQIAAAALAVGSVSLAVVGLPKASTLETGTPIVIPEPPIVDNADSIAEASTDPRAVATRFELVKNRPVAAGKTPDDQTPDAANTDTAAVATEVRYLGSLAESGRRIALIRIGDRQRLLAPGQSAALPEGGTIKVVDVLADRITIEDSSGKRDIQRSARAAGATVVSKAEPAPVVAPPVEEQAQNPNSRRRRRFEGPDGQIQFPEGTPDAVRERIMGRVREGNARREEGGGQ